MTVAAWVPIITMGVVQLALLGFFIGACRTELRNTVETMKTLIAEVKALAKEHHDSTTASAVLTLRVDKLEHGEATIHRRIDDLSQRTDRRFDESFRGQNEILRGARLRTVPGTAEDG